jgi:hypothetical protein
MNKYFKMENVACLHDFPCYNGLCQALGTKNQTPSRVTERIYSFGLSLCGECWTFAPHLCVSFPQMGQRNGYPAQRDVDYIAQPQVPEIDMPLF